MDDTPTFPSLHTRAIALRRAGKSRREIKELLGLTYDKTLTELLRGEPAPAWTRRPNAKDDLRARARALRAQGKSYNEIAAELGVSKSSCSLWLRDMPRPISKEEAVRRSVEARAPGCERRHARTREKRLATKLEAAAEVGELTERDLLLAGAIIYRCEGAKREGRVDFCNTDPALIDLFHRFLDATGVARDRLRYQLQIHENADRVAAEEFWAAVTGAGRAQFGKPVLKPDRPGGNRLNTGSGYRGCLRVTVRDARRLSWWIEGLARAVLGTEPADITGLPQGTPVTDLRDQAVELRRSGSSRAAIQERLGIGAPWLLDALIKGEPPNAAWTARATAAQLDEDRARELRAQGWGCRRISERLGVPRERVRRWLADTQIPSDEAEGSGDQRIAGIQRHWDGRHAAEEVERRLVWEEASGLVGELDEREVRFLGALAYWCEGGKDKPYRRRERVQFINSDSGLIRFFLRFLDTAGVARSRLMFRVHIHELGDIEGARRFWSETVGVDPDGAFAKDTIKRHVPQTVHPEFQQGYHGCLEVYLADGADLYRRIEGWALGPVLGEDALVRWRS